MSDNITECMCDDITKCMDDDTLNVWVITSLNIWVVTSLNVRMMTSLNVWVITSLNLWGNWHLCVWSSRLHVSLLSRQISSFSIIVNLRVCGVKQKDPPQLNVNGLYKNVTIGYDDNIWFLCSNNGDQYMLERFLQHASNSFRSQTSFLVLPSYCLCWSRASFENRA